MTRFIYRLGLKTYYLLIWLASFFNDKAKRWIDGRRSIWEKLAQAMTQKKGSLIWVHCASLGEFEQGRPLIERIRKQHPDYQIVLTFFSPSGYEVRKDYDQVDWVFYLPIDSPQNAKRFIKLTAPKLAVFVKYEFWYDYLNALFEANVPTVLVSAHFRANQVFFRCYGGLFRELLKDFDQLFVQDEKSLQLLANIGVKHAQAVGDTRLDRVLAIKAKAKEFDKVDQFVNDSSVLVAGSTWAADEAILADFFREYLQDQGWKMIVAPHEIDEAHLGQLEQRFEGIKTQRYSQFSVKDRTATVLIIDNIGMLSSLYRYAKVAYIGGGFGAGIHNVLEAIVYEIPVFFGPKNERFLEAQELKRLGVGIEIENVEQLMEQFDRINQPDGLEAIADQAQDYLNKHRGATQKIMNYLTKHL